MNTYQQNVNMSGQHEGNVSVDLESYNMNEFTQLKEQIVINTQQYLELWDLSQKNMIDIEKIDELTTQIEKKTAEVRHLWDTITSSRGADVPKKLKMQYIKYLIDVTPHKDDGFALLRKYESDLGIHKDKDFGSYDADNNRTGKESPFDDERMRSIKREIINMQNNHELPRSAMILKILGLVFFIIIIGLNSLEWHMSADNFTDHLKNVRKISLTNQLQTESQSLVSYIQDMSYLQYQQYNLEKNKQLPEADRNRIKNEIVKNTQNYIVGLEESIDNIQSISDYLRGNFSSRMQDYEWTSIKFYTGGKQNDIGYANVSEVNSNIFTLSREVLTQAKQGDLSKIFSYYAEEVTEQGESQRQKIYYILLNLLNDIPIEQQKLYLKFVEEFSDETQEVADTNTIMLVFILFMVFQIIFILCWLIYKVGKNRQKAFKKLLKIPIEVQGKLYDQCKSLLTEQLGVNETEVINKLKSHNKDGYQHFEEEDINEEAGNSNKDKDDLLNSEVDEAERKKHLYNVFKTKIILFTSILVLLMNIYFVSNFLVQKYLANDMQVYVNVENSTSISESFYMFSDNTLRMNLLNWTLPVIHQDSYQTFKINVLSMNDKERDINDFDDRINNLAMRKIFDRIMVKNPCQVIADGSTKVYTAEECEEFGNGIVKEGLMKSMEYFVNVTTIALEEVRKIHKDQEIIVRESILQIEGIKLARVLQRIYIKEGLLVLKDQLRQQMEKEMTNFLHWKQFSWYGGFIIILITYLQLHFQLIKNIPLGILRARKSLNVIPIDNL